MPTHSQIRRGSRLGTGSVRRPALPVLALLLPVIAQAHVPHDVVTAIAPAVGLAPDRPWWLVADHDDVSDLYRSDDAGRTWDATFGACLVDRLTAAATLDDGAVVVIGAGRAWWSADGEGTLWTPVTLPFTPTAVAGADQLYLTGSDGVWTLDANGSAAQVWAGGAVFGLYAGDGGVVALLDGEAAFLREGVWSVVETPAGASAATLDAVNVYIGTDRGDVHRWDGEAWWACGLSPLIDEDPVHPDVMRLATDGVTLALAHADAGPATSTDGCETWTSDAAPLDLVWENEVTPDDYYDFTELEEAFTALGVGGDSLVVGTYDGVAARVDGVWSKPPLKGADYFRGAAFSRSFATDGLVLLAAYGCGIQRGFEAGARWDCPGVGIDKPAVQAIVVPIDAVGLVPAYALSNRVPVRSDDGGATWHSIVGDFGPAHGLEAGPNGRVWLFPVQSIADGAPADTLRSDDGGVSWSAVPGLSVTGDHKVAGLVDRGSLVVAFTGDKDDATPESVYVSSDGETFVAVHEMADVLNVAAWPEAAPDRIVAVGPTGIDVQADGVWFHATDEAARRVVAASDGTLIAATPTQRLLRSTDDGHTWTDVGAQLVGQVEALGTHPDFASHPEIVAMGPSGAFRVDSEGTVTRWTGLQQADDQSHYAEYVAYDPPSDDVLREGALLGIVHEVPAGGRATVWLRGTSVELVGAIDGAASLILTVDGVATGSTAAGPVVLGGLIAHAEGLQDTLHLVELQVVEGDGVVLDAARGIAPSNALGWETTVASKSRCGCAVGSEGPYPPGPGNGATFAWVGWWISRRRRR